MRLQDVAGWSIWQQQKQLICFPSTTIYHWASSHVTWASTEPPRASMGATAGFSLCEWMWDIPALSLAVSAGASAAFCRIAWRASAWASERVFKICGCLYCTGVFRRLSPGCKIVYLQESLWQHLHDCHINDLSRASSCNPPEDEVSKEEEVNTWDKVYAPAETSDLGAESNRQDMGLNLLIHSLSRLLLVSLILILCFFDSLQFMFEFVTWVNGICIAFSLAPSLRLWPKLFSFFLYSHFLSLSAWPGISFSSRVVGLDDLRMQRDIVSLAFDWLSTYHQRAALIGWTKMHSTVASIRGGKWHERSRDLSLEQGESVNAVTHFHSTQVAPPADSPLLLLD